MSNTLFRGCASLALAVVAVVNPHLLTAQLKPQPVLTAAPVPLHGGDGAAIFTLTNSSQTPISLTLTAGPLLDTASHAILARTKATLTPIAGITSAPSTPTPPAAGIPAPNASAQTAAPASIPPGETLSYQLSVTGVSGASAAEVDLFNGSAKLGTIPILAVDAPLAIAVDGDGSASDTPLAYSFDRHVFLTLKNNDAQPYHVRWAFQLDGETMSSDTIDIASGGSARISIKDPCDKIAKIKIFFQHLVFFGSAHEGPCDAYWFFDRIHPSAKHGYLHLSLVGPDALSGIQQRVPIAQAASGEASQTLAGLLPVRTLPVNLTMHRVSSAWSNFYAYLYAGVLLLLGGFFSFLASSVLPSMQRRGDLRAQLQELANRTTSVSNRIDSYLRVLLRLERSRVADALDNSPAWIPASADPVELVTASMQTLGKRLTAAEHLDDLRRKHDQINASAPPSVTDSIDLYLQSAADRLHSIALSESDLTAANNFLAKAQASLEMLDDSAAMAKLISANVNALNTRLAKFPPNYYADLKAALPGVFLIIDPSRGYDDAKNIVRPMFFAIDHGVAAIQLALDYAMVRASIPGKVPDSAPTPSTTPGAASTAPAPGTDPALNAAAVHDTAVAAQASAVAAQTTAAALGTPTDIPFTAAAVIPPNDAPPLTLPITANQCVDLGELQRERLLTRQCLLIELLGTLSWRALRQANLLVQEMREDTYEEDILDEIAKPGRAEITYDTQKTRPYLPVFFTITFKNSRFNGAAAQQRLICHWTFPDGLQERSWNVCHYFTGFEPEKPNLPADATSSLPSSEPETSLKLSAQPATLSTPPAQPETPPPSSSKPLAQIRPLSKKSPFHLAKGPLAFFRNPEHCTVDLIIEAAVSGQKFKDTLEKPNPPLTTTIQLQSPSAPERSRASADFLRFLIAFTVALAGLFSGALDQLGKLDFISATIAIVALGFGANSIKNILTQSAPVTPLAKPTPKS